MATTQWRNSSETQPGTRWSTLALLWAHRRFLMLFVALCVLLSTAREILTHDFYQSTVRILPPEANPNSLVAAALGVMGGGINATVGDAFNVKTKGALYLSLLQSRNVLDAMIFHFDLKKAYHEKYMYAARRDLASRTIGDEDRKSGVISITVIDRDPKRAAEIANGYVSEMNRVSAESNIGAAHRERLFLDERLAEVKRDLNETARQLAEVSSKNRMMDFKNQGQATIAEGTQLQGKIIAAESELRGLEQIYGSDNARVRASKASVSEMRRELDNIGGNDESAGDDRLAPSLRKLPLLGVEYADLYRRVSVQESVFEMLTRQDELAKVEEAKELPVLRVLDSAEISEKPTGPRRLRAIALSLVLSMGAAVMSILLLGFWQSLSPGDSKKQLIRELSVYLRQTRTFQTLWPTPKNG